MVSNCGTVTVRPSFDPSLVSTGGCSIGNQTIQPGTTITVSGTVSNGNEYDDANATVVLLVDGSQQASTSVTIPAGSSENVSFDVSFDAAGDYQLTTEVSSASAV